MHKPRLPWTAHESGGAVASLEATAFKPRQAKTSHQSHSTPVGPNASQGHAADGYSGLSGGLAGVATPLVDCDFALTACRKRQCIHWRSAYRRVGRPGWVQKFDW